MTSPHYAERAAKLLRDDRDAEVPEPSAEARRASIEAIAQAIVARKRAQVRSRRMRVGFGALAAAAVIAIASGAALMHGKQADAPVAQRSSDDAVTVVAHASGGGASVVASSGAPVAALGQTESDARALERGSRVIAGATGHAMLAFSTGTVLDVDHGGDLTVVSRGSEQRFHLSSGEVHANVAKLGKGDRFIVETADAEVEVRGTQFDVGVIDASTCGAGVQTRVTVREGVVVVRHAGAEDRVSAGQSWPANCTASAEAAKGAPAEAANAAASKPAIAASQASLAKGSVAAQPAPASLLAQQNDLFQQGVAAKRRGDASEAVATFDRYLATYPSSQLAESATVERMRALRSVDATRSRDAARKYLDAYPSGFARAEAEALLAQSP